MKFILKTFGSMVFGYLGSWLGGFIGLGTQLFLSLTLSIIGWYWTKNFLDKNLP